MESVRDFSSDHVKHLKRAMDDLVAAGVDDGFVIFETDEGRFCQFTYSRGQGLIFDLPRIGLSEDEQKRVSAIEAMEAMTETDLSYIVQIGVDTRMGAVLADRVFREIFLCPANYHLQATVDI